MAASSYDWDHGVIGFVGTGNLTRAVAGSFAAHGIPVRIASRTYAKAEALAHQIGCEPAKSIKALINECGTIWLSLKDASGRAVIAFLEEHQSSLVGQGKILIETSDPYLEGRPPPPPHESAMTFHAETLRIMGDDTTFWATAYKSITSRSIVAGKKQPTEMCGDSRAKAVLRACIERDGWEAVDCGGLDKAPLLEPRGPKRVKHKRIAEYDRGGK
jgi:predicted dinucleotide-binding enzyme